MGSMISADDSGTVKQSCGSLRSLLGCQDWRVSPTLWHVWKWKHFSAALLLFFSFLSVCIFTCREVTILTICFLLFLCIDRTNRTCQCIKVVILPRLKIYPTVRESRIVYSAVQGQWLDVYCRPVRLYFTIVPQSAELSLHA